MDKLPLQLSHNIIKSFLSQITLFSQDSYIIWLMIIMTTYR